MDQSFGRGRGSLISKMLALSNSSNTDDVVVSPTHDGLMTPDQFMKAELEETDSKIKAEVTKVFLEEQIPTNSQHPAESKSNENQFPAVTENSTRNETFDQDQADKEWKIYQFQRKIKKIVKNVNDTNLDEVIAGLESILEECPLSSRFTCVSEAREVLEVIMLKALKDSNFLVYAPCVMKMVAELQTIEFKKYFAEIADQIQKDHVTLCASDDLLSKTGKNFCQFIGCVLAMPRQTGTDFYDVVLPVAEEFMDTWSYPYEEDFCFDGFKEKISMIHASAAKEFLLSVTSHLLPCDTVLMERIERFMWQLRESILNIKLPRTVRSSYLDAFTDVQMSRVTSGWKTENISLDHTVSDKEDCENGDMVIEGIESISEDQKEVIPVDEYLAVKGLLIDLDMEELLPIFIANKINEDKLFTSNFESDLELAGVKKFQRFNIMLKVGSTDIAELRKLVTDETRKLETEEKTENVDVLETETGGINDFKPDQQRKSASSRMAINFKTAKKDSMLIKPMDDSNMKNFERRGERIDASSSIQTIDDVNVTWALSDENSNISSNQSDETRPNVSSSNQSDDSRSHVSSSNQSDDSEPDVVLESEEYEQVTSSEDTLEIKPQKTTCESVVSPLPSAPTGRGRGMVSLKNNTVGGTVIRKPPFKNRQDDRVNRVDHVHRQHSPGSRQHSAGGARWSERGGGRPQQHTQNERTKPTERNFNRNPSRYNNEKTFISKEKFQSRYHKKNVSKDDEGVSSASPPAIGGFGLRKPRGCLRCGKMDHISDDCPVINPFF